MKSKLLILTALIVALGAGHALAERGHGPRSGAADAMSAEGMSPERLLHRMERVLDLDDAQHEALLNIVKAAEPEFEALGDEARAQAKAMHDLDVSADDYAVQLQNLASRAGELASKSVLLRGRVRAEINAELTAAQLAQLTAAFEARRGHRHERRSRREPDAG